MNVSLERPRAADRINLVHQREFSQPTAMPALDAAERLLAETVEDISPDTPAPALLACIARYRAQLATLAAAYRLEA